MTSEAFQGEVIIFLGLLSLPSVSLLTATRPVASPAVFEWTLFFLKQSPFGLLKTLKYSGMRWEGGGDSGLGRNGRHPGEPP